MYWMRSSVFACALLFGGNALAQQTEPVIVSERAQEIAAGYPIADRLGIDWDGAEPADTGRYIGLIAAAETVAREIARRNEREEPIDADYHSAFIVFCLWPPNKPPLVEKYWEVQETAYFDSEMRSILADAVRDVAVKMPAFFSDFDQSEFEAVNAELPIDQKSYFDFVFDLRPLETDR